MFITLKKLLIKCLLMRRSKLGLIAPFRCYHVINSQHTLGIAHSPGGKLAGVHLGS